jgi:hypothetical protein
MGYEEWIGSRMEAEKVYQSKKVEAPHRLITPGIADVAECCGFFDGGDSFRGVITKETLGRRQTKKLKERDHVLR